MTSYRFVLNGESHGLDRAAVESRLSGLAPEPVRLHAVQVRGVWYPVLQAFEAAIQRPRTEFTSHTARRHLARLGFEVRHDGPRAPARAEGSQVERRASRGAALAGGSEWHSEADVQALLVNHLAAQGWSIRSVANTATKERGVDVVAELDGVMAGFEVKGYPSRRYADPRRADEVKKTQPSTQAGHWYAGAVLAAMRLRTKQSDWRSIIALPDFSRYRTLNDETRSSLDAAGIEVWWVAEDGDVR